MRDLDHFSESPKSCLTAKPKCKNISADNITAAETLIKRKHRIPGIRSGFFAAEAKKSIGGRQ